MEDLPAIRCITRYVGNYYRYELTNELASALRDSLSRGQLMSKLKSVKLAKNYVPDNCDAFFIGHWHGLLPMFFYEYGLIKTGSGIELDPFWVNFSNEVNQHWSWKSTQGDADSFKLPETDLIVNTSCEHMTDSWLDAVPAGTLVCAQSTDYKHSTHINTVESLDEFLEKWGNFYLLESSADKYDVYSRFTVIARKQ